MVPKLREALYYFVVDESGRGGENSREEYDRVRDCFFSVFFLCVLHLSIFGAFGYKISFVRTNISTHIYTMHGICKALIRPHSVCRVPGVL